MILNFIFRKTEKMTDRCCLGVGLSGIVVKVIADCPGTSWIYVNRNITRGGGNNRKSSLKFRGKISKG